MPTGPLCSCPAATGLKIELPDGGLGPGLLADTLCTPNELLLEAESTEKPVTLSAPGTDGSSAVDALASPNIRLDARGLLAGSCTCTRTNVPLPQRSEGSTVLLKSS